MSRLLLAFSCFFRVLFTAQLPKEAAKFLPPGEGGEPEKKAADPVVPAVVVEKSLPKSKPATEVKKSPTKNISAHHRDGAMALLGLMQREGRLVDFLAEPIDDYEDEEIGAAVRDIHRGCKKVLDDYLSFEAVLPGEEEEKITVPTGFDPGEIRLIGNISGEPPFHGILRHHGWRATKISLPTLSEGVDRNVVAPAEVELS